MLLTHGMPGPAPLSPTSVPQHHPHCESQSAPQRSKVHAEADEISGVACTRLSQPLMLAQDIEKRGQSRGRHYATRPLREGERENADGLLGRTLPMVGLACT